MKGLSRRIAFLPSSIGWTGGIGLALLFSACVLGFTLLLPAREEGDSLRDELLQLERKLGRLDPAAQPVATLSQQLGEFLKRFAEFYGPLVTAEPGSLVAALSR